MRCSQPGRSVSLTYGLFLTFSSVDGLVFPSALLIGNAYASETIGGWHDASKGTLLLGNGHGKFKGCHESGFRADKVKTAPTGFGKHFFAHSVTFLSD
ncbi:hypothetical protein [Larkinella terrae]|uniref:Uncharacterized protein n=1 Tax=Larkinella terrae TaxID=2025311 RepID=A0A7K0EDY1_9BACT|nr:hypothetical protein [Larkinella terrae]MRS60033.1 hypothetical protein [Larkinella terrae]